ncbi:MAG: type I secretion system permease/ATPase, partial [Hyphomicrobiales bacterium]|nr:type I secretion system permease/ATPase [Hyphomicrobiales bacterium]
DSAVILSLRLGQRAERLDPVRDLDQLRQFLSGPGPLAIFDVPWMPIYIAIIFLFHPLLGWLAVAGAIILMVLTLLNEIVSRQPLAQAGQVGLRRAGLVEASRRNSEVLSAMGMLANIRALWNRENSGFLDKQAQAADRIALFSSLTKTIRFVLQSAMLGVGAYLVLQQEITAGVMIAGSIILSRALSPVEQAVAHWRGFVTARQSLARLRTSIDQLPEDTQKTPLPSPAKSLQAKNVCVVPPGEQILTLQGTSFALEAGSGLGVIGPSASGKSTLARALVGVWPVARGEVRLDGATLDQWDPAVLGRAIGYMPQDIELFGGSVADNIARFEAERDDDAIIEAAQLAGVHDMILSLDGGYDSEIGEAGTVLSAGQRQRIGLARAMYRNPFLIVLDEPNSNLDADGDAALTRSVQAMRERGSIVIVIAHRPSAIAALDLLLVIQNGRQEAFGPKAEVLAKMTHQVAANKQGLKVVKD